MASKDDNHSEVNRLEWYDPRNVRPKRMRVDLSETPSPLEDLYEFKPDVFVNSLLFPHFHRPLPAFTNLLSNFGTGLRKENKNIVDGDIEEYKVHNLPPFLQEFFHRVNCNATEDITDQQNVDVIEESSDIQLELLDSLTLKIPPFETKSAPSTVQDTPPLLLDRNSALLTQAHHRRLIAYLSELDQGDTLQWDRLDARRLKEFQKLCSLLQEERIAYFQAMREFREAYMNRFLLGFKVEDAVSSFVRAYPEHYIQFYKHSWVQSDWKNHTHFGIHSTQAIALECYACKIEENSFRVDLIESLSDASTIKHFTKSYADMGEKGLIDYGVETAPRVKQQSSSLSSSLHEAHKMLGLDEAILSPNIVYASTDHNIRRLEETWLDSCLAPGTVLHPQSNIPLLCLYEDYCFLSDDRKAKDLACQYSADVIMTSRTMEYLLQRPGSCTTQWNIPISYEDISSSSVTHVGRKKSNMIVIMEDPIPQSLTPRQCLNFGVSDAILRQIVQSNPSSHNKEKGKDSSPLQVVFTLLTFPGMGGGMAIPIKVLVRTYNHIHDELGNPIKIHSKLEYFLDMGLEEQTSYERSIWKMDKLLQPNGRVFLCRINVETMTVVSTDDVTSAQFIVDQNKSKSLASRILLPLDNDERIHFQSFAFLLHGIVKNTCKGKYLFCIPSKDRSVPLLLTTATIHKSLGRYLPQEATTSRANTVIDVEQELDTATQVSLGRQSLCSCFNLWTWTHEKNRIPYTFRPLN